MHATSARGTRFGAVAALAFATLLFMTVAVVDAPRAATDEEVIAWWSEESNQTAEVFSMFFAFGAALSLLAFLSVVAPRLRAAEGGEGRVAAFVYASGIVYVVLLLLAGVLRGAVASSVLLGDEPLPGVDTLRLVPAASWVLLGSLGLPLAATCVAAVSWLVLRTRLLGRWVGWLGLGVAAALLGAVVIGPWLIPLLLLWSLSMAVALWRGQPALNTRPAHTSTGVPLGT
ncbi:MAG: hypothetical protein AB7I38_05740 [Dehalococcoidia bacterium]